MTGVVVGVDGGNSKTDVAVADLDGTVRTVVRGPGASPDKLGEGGALEVITGLVERALCDAGAGEHEMVAISTLLAGLDLPEDVPAFERVLAERYPRSAIVVDNDTLAVLLAGTGGEPGVAVVCGAGINAVGLSPSGTRAGFLSLGQLSGDWGGGLGLGREVLWHAIRDEDGRGPSTVLRSAVQRHFGASSVTEVALAIHRGELPEHDLSGLVPVLIEADRAGDPAATDLIDRLADETAGMAHLMLRRCELDRRPAPVVLAGGILTNPRSRVATLVTDRLAELCPTAEVSLLGCRPVAGALLAALREVGHGTVAAPVAARVTGASLLRTTADGGALAERQA